MKETSKIPQRSGQYVSEEEYKEVVHPNLTEEQRKKLDEIDSKYLQLRKEKDELYAEMEDLSRKLSKAEKREQEITSEIVEGIDARSAILNTVWKKFSGEVPA